MSVTRYTEPLPHGAVILETWEQVKQLAIANPFSGLEGDIGEAHFIMTDDGVILGVASDDLCEEIDAKIADIEMTIQEET